MFHNNKIKYRSIREYLNRTGKTEGQLANLVNITQAYVNMLKNRKRRPTPELARKIEAVTGIPLNNLLFEEGRNRTGLSGNRPSKKQTTNNSLP